VEMPAASRRAAAPSSREETVWGAAGVSLPLA